MATRFFLTDSTAGVPATSDVDYLASFSRGDAAVSDTCASDDNGSATTTERINESGTRVVWWTPPLSAATVSGTITVNLRAAESNMNANQQIFFDVDWYSGDGATFKGSLVVDGSEGAELGTSEAARNFTKTPTSRTLVDGDRLRINVGNLEIGAGATGHTTTLWYDGPTAATSGDSWIEFTETLTEFTPAADRYAGLVRPLAALDAVHRAANWFRRLDGLLVPRRRPWQP